MSTDLVQLADSSPAAGLTPEQRFHQERSLGIGGSDVGAVFNEGYGCARALAYDKLGIPRDFSHTEKQQRIFRRGHALEELAAQEYSALTGRKIRHMGMRQSASQPWMIVHTDRQITTTLPDNKRDPRGPGLLECKSASPWVFEEMAESGLPEQYALQLQHGIIVTGYAWGAFSVLDTTNYRDPLIFERSPNPQLAKIIMAREADFWQQYIEPSRQVLADNPDAKVQSLLPILQLPAQLENPRDRRCASCLWRFTCRGQKDITPDPAQTGYVVDDGLSELGADYISALNAVTRYAGIADEIKERLKQACGARPGVIIPSIQKRIRYKQQKGRQGWDTAGLESATRGVDSLRALISQRQDQSAEWAQLAITLETISTQLAASRKRGEPTRPFYFEECEEAGGM